MAGVAGGIEVWRQFDLEWYRFAYPLADRILTHNPSLQGEDVMAALVPLYWHDPNPWFSESWYLDRYPSVRAAVDAGDYRSGFEYFCREGHRDHSPHWLFDPGYYRDSFRSRYRRDFDPASDGDPYNHFLRIGQFDGLSGHWLFDSAVYAAMAPFDVRARILSDGAFSTLMHHLRIGAAEPVVSCWFDPAWYSARYPQVTAGIHQGRWTCALQHYLQDPEAAAFDPSPRFSEQAYRTYFSDVAEAIRDGAFRNGYDHFLRHGQHEGRIVSAASAVPGQAATVPFRPPTITDRFPLRTRVFDGLTFLPVERMEGDGDRWHLGVLDSAGAPVAAFEDQWCELQTASSGEVRDVDGTFIYGGVLPNHYGQLLLDGLLNLWFVHENPDLPVLWHSLIRHDNPLLAPADFPGWLQQIWTILGLDRRRHLHVREAVRVKRVIRPDPGRPNIHSLHPRLIAALGVHRTVAQPTGNRVWMSRRGLARDRGRIEPEEAIEAVLADHGWMIVRPEALPVAAQIDLFCTASVISGCIGSAFHTVLLSAEPTARLIPVIRPGVPLEFYDTVAQALALRQDYVVPDLHPFEMIGPDSVATMVDPRAVADAVCALADSA